MSISVFIINAILVLYKETMFKIPTNVVGWWETTKNRF